MTKLTAHVTVGAVWKAPDTHPPLAAPGGLWVRSDYSVRPVRCRTMVIATDALISFDHITVCVHQHP
ncbi:MAG: hypothetical protein ACRDTF_01045, partial [Pseudonocardiaceae bacterium]